MALSPVTMRTVTPAPRSSATASAVSGRIGSLMPVIASSVKSRSGAVSPSLLGAVGVSMYAMHNVRRPRRAKCSMAASASLSFCGVNVLTLPSAPMTFVHSLTTISEAPLTCKRDPEPLTMAVDMRLRAEVKWYRCASGNFSRNSMYD